MFWYADSVSCFKVADAGSPATADPLIPVRRLVIVIRAALTSALFGFIALLWSFLNNIGS